MGLTRFVLKRPVATVMALLCLLVFGISSVFNATLEQMPDTDQPMLIIIASYSGAGPEDIDELVTQPIEDQVGTIEGVKSMSSTSSENRAMIMLEYDYGTDMDDAYNDLSQSLDALSRQLPDDAETSVMEMNNNAGTTMMLSISNPSQEDLYDYVDQTVVPLLEQISSVAEVEAMGGKSEYYKIELQSDEMAQYQVTMSDVSTAMSTANLSYPSGDAVSGKLELSVSTSLEHETIEALREVPITTSSGKIVYLEDIARVYEAEESRGGISRYNGEDTISISITKQQSSTAMDVSSEVQEVIESLEADDENLNIRVVRDSADSILSSLKDVALTLVLAAVISMIIIFIFFGDYKASLIVGSSIPTSILVSLILMTSAGFSLNIITMSGLVLGVGMMVTTCVVFLPLVFLQGMSGQMFGSMGYVIVFCMLASFLSAITIVPLTYMAYKPQERMQAPMSRPMERIQNGYRRIMPGLLNHKAIIMIASVILVIAAYFLASGMETELMTADDTGTVSVSIETRPGLLSENADAMLLQAEEIVQGHPDVESYMLRYNNDSGTITAYLRDNRDMSTDEVVEQWETEMADLDNCTVTVEASSSMSFMSRNRGYEVILNGTDYDELQEVSNKIVAEMTARDDVMNVHSSIENTAPVVTVKVDPVLAAAEGLTASQIGSQVKQMMDGEEVTTLDVDGREVSVMAEYPEDEYRTVSQMKDIILSKPSGGYVALTDVAEIYYKDSPASISKTDKAYEITITADYTGGNVQSAIDSEVINPNLSGTIKRGVNSMNRMMQEEFAALYQAIAVAVFLVFVVLSAQFESPKFSFMVMTTIPFSLIGSFGLLQITGVSISMTSILGFLILVGTVVNNGILYVDTVNQYRMTMDLKTALIEAGATRLRPIMMTSLTTILSMIPMALAIGDSGSTTQGLAIVNIGGLSVGVAVALFILPIYYALMNGDKKRVVLDI